MRVSEILRQTSAINGASDNRKLEELANSIHKSEFKFQNVGALRASGETAEFDGLQHQLFTTNAYQAAAKSVGSTLDRQLVGINDVLEVMTWFRGNFDQKGGDDAWRIRYANDALAELQRILNSATDEGYLFGGDNLERKPIKIDLVTIPVINSITDYTDSVANMTEVNVSEIHSVRSNVLSANSEGFKSLIDLLKLGQQPAFTPANRATMDDLIQQAMASFTATQSKILIEKERVQEAVKYNQTALLETEEELTSKFETTPEADAINFKNKVCSEMMSLKLMQAYNKLSDYFFNTI